MGFYKFYCKKCDWEVEGMCHHDEFDNQVCGDVDYYGRPKFWFDDKDCTPITEGCGNIMERVWQPMSFHIAGASLDTHGVHNVNGYFSPSFGRYFKNKHAAFEYAESQGLRQVSEAEADEAMYNRAEEKRELDRVSAEYKANLEASGGDKVAAAAKTFVPADMQDK